MCQMSERFSAKLRRRKKNYLNFYPMQFCAKMLRHLPRLKLLLKIQDLFSSNSRGSCVGRYVVKMSKYLETPYFSDTILCQNGPISDTFQIASQNLVLFSSNSRGSYVERYVVKISNSWNLYFFPTQFCAETLLYLIYLKFLLET